ncbi:DNA repair photolyase [Bacillus mesophilus]|uniref:Radical SAM protein n=1 Tax=Bacillus mesophilus TaxID=1808955 RepID=A0A6M0Q551_9BACI|nr:radical SAM protein [Bacillus mesophilus]MBM7660950.1 DNA repair photolyase [Bacillus mesophilus]NEY71507.1 radical SAM protein [Bacillus mesophilus]
MINITEKMTKQLLTPASGFLEGYTFSLNPYIGCSFGCSYCYVRKMPVNLFRKEDWGTWVDIKKNAKEQYIRDMKKARKKYESVSIFMSSSTDPYQPTESDAEITRSLLEAMNEEPPDFLFVQTRSPLVKRDLGLLKGLGERVLLSMTVETDLDEVRRIFSPTAPPIAARMSVLKKFASEGIPTQAAVAPLLPFSDNFASTLASTVNRVTIDDYFMGDGSKGKRTTSLGIEKLYKEHKLEEWYHPEAYKKLVEELTRYMPKEQIFVSQDGFLPPVKK